MEGTKNFYKFLEDISKGVRFYKADALQPIYLLKRAFLLKKINGQAKILMNNPRGVFRTQSHIYAFINFFKNVLSQMLHWILNTPLSSERLLQEYDCMTNSPSLMI